MRALNALGMLCASGDAMSGAFRELVFCVRRLGISEDRVLELESAASAYATFARVIDESVRAAINGAAAKKE